MPDVDPLNIIDPTIIAENPSIAASLVALRHYPDSEVTEIPEDRDYDHRLTKVALLSAQVCTRKTAQEAADWLSLVRPPGTTYNRWEPSDVDEVTCEQFPATHRHVIVEC